MILVSIETFLKKPRTAQTGRSGPGAEPAVRPAGEEEIVIDPAHASNLGVRSVTRMGDYEVEVKLE